MIEMVKNIILTEKEKDIKDNINELLKTLETEIKNYVSRHGWKINNSRTQVSINKKEDRGGIFVEKVEKETGEDNKNYEIGIEHFDFYYVEDKQKRDDYIFCGRFYPNKTSDGKWWSRKKHITNYKGVEMRTNSQEYAGLLLTENIDDLVSHFLEEFKIYFNNNKY